MPFVIQVQLLNTVDEAMPPENKTPNYNHAYQDLINLSQSYTQALTQAQQGQQPQAPHNPAPIYEPTAERRDSVLDTTITREVERQRTKPETDEVKPHLKSQINSIVLSLRSVSRRLQTCVARNATAHAPAPPPPANNDSTNPRQRLAIATKALENNVGSFTEFLVAYLNGRYEHLGKDLRPKLKALLEPFFADPSDARTLLARIISDTKGVVRVERGEMQLLGGDLMVPVGDLLEALIAVLEEMERAMDG